MNTLQELKPNCAWPIHGRDGIRALEGWLQTQTQQPLMQQAGLAAAQLAMAIAPHARSIWVVAGPGNNGGDGLEAACHLQQWGKCVQVALLGDVERLPADAKAAWERAQTAGVAISAQWPAHELLNLGPHDLVIDALLGIGANRPLEGRMVDAVQTLNQSPAQALSMDVPTGLDAESGELLGGKADAICVHADHTITFIAGKPGLFMGHGRDACGKIWLADLGGAQAKSPSPPAAWLNTGPWHKPKSHASHKGTHGDVAVIGGQADEHGMGMTGAAVLAATAALNAGAGRVMLSLLSGHASATAASDLMQRHWQDLDLEHLHVVCGCGGGASVKAALPAVLQRSRQLVLDADGLNGVSQDPVLQAFLRQRSMAQATVITPHPLEAARLLNISTAQVQHNRLDAAHLLANLFQCTVVLKGSGTVIASPGQTPRINHTGNGRLATGGTGDVLAGLIGARMAQGMGAFEAACSGVAQHGQVANDWPQGVALTASRLVERLA